MTVPTRCPYLPDEFERKIFTQLHGRSAEILNDALTNAGFRRSQNIAYKPACENCAACLSVRIPVDEFQWTKSFKRVVKRNEHLVAETVPPVASDEQFDLLRDYLNVRHTDGGMAGMTVLDYAAMVEESAVRTHLVEYRDVECLDPSAEPGDPKVSSDSNAASGCGPLVAAALTDILGDGLSMVYSFFDVSRTSDSLGSFLILDHIRQVQEMGLRYLYLGYWVKNSPKMAYKARYRPLEYLGPNGWVPLSQD